jgi:hypothetical protein
MRLTRDNLSRCIATLANANTRWTLLGSNPCLRGDRPTINRLNHSTAVTFLFRTVATIITVISWQILYHIKTLR